MEDANLEKDREKILELREQWKQIVKEIWVIMKQREKTVKSYWELKKVTYWDKEVYRLDYNFKIKKINDIESRLDKRIDKALNKDWTKAEEVIATRNEFFLALKEIIKAKIEKKSKLQVKKIQKTAIELYKNLLISLK